MNDNSGSSDISVESGKGVGKLDRLSLGAIILAGVLVLISVMATRSFVFNERRSRIDYYVEAASARIDSQADTISESIGRSLGYLSGVPFVVANNPLISEALKRMSGAVPEGQDHKVLRNRWSKDPRLAVTNRYLQLMNRRLDVDQVWVMNDRGYCIASSNKGPDSPIGIEYTNRRFFHMAKEQGYGRQFAVGRTTHLPGLYFSSDIRDEKGNFLGVAAAKRNIGNLVHLIENTNTLITDELGVVILATDQKLLMKSMPGSRIATLPVEERIRRYHREVFPELALRSIPSEGKDELFLLGSDTVPLLMTIRHRPTEDIRIHVFSRLSNISRIDSDSRWMFLVLSAVGSLSILLILSAVLFVFRNRRHNKMLQEMNSLLQQQAYTDQLTGCLNRRRWMELSALGVERASRYGHPLSLVTLDLDHFKEVNDSFGHPAGDEVLRRFTQMLQQTVRKFDIVGRLGGEEFAVMLPETPLDMAQALAERIRAMVQEMSFRFHERDATITVSLGVAQHKADQPLDDLLKQADDALYEAKHKGRNRVCCSE